MQQVNYETWERKETFEFFSAMSYPFYSVTFKLDVTKLYNYVKKKRISFYYALVYLCTEAINEIDAFLYLSKGKEIYKLEKRIPSFTDIKKGSDKFYIVTIPASETLELFCQEAKVKSESQTSFIDSKTQTEELIYFSCLPWIEMTAFTTARDFDHDDAVPRVTWGKYTDENGKKVLQIALEINHRLLDGIHIGRLNEILNKKIDALQ